MPDLDVPDLNVWLALTDPDHQHHPRARHYWETESLPELAFCRVTMLGLLRLLTHPKVMAGNPFTVTEAWAAYSAYAALPEIQFIEESALAERFFARWTQAPGFAAHLWTDAWIASVARSADARIVSFDRDFMSFDNLRFLHLKA
jgi:toxin-antitoxin system PIN domain toxin